MIWTVLAGILLLLWTVIFLTAFCPLRAARRRQEARQVAVFESNDKY
ncbi:hypothetical protein SAMN05660860_03321 [Geoalkalibacter ferrihydriticus]|uniref:Uncharacterized protein n=1 Tax=Geoalkalibacter ferrihydriticus TaxID=392333 RepID=A0A1G9WUT7_9BACT|nr:hypothetical protein SAMN05660860_03321 [Geoalkalibacter ferrihydriticus]